MFMDTKENQFALNPSSLLPMNKSFFFCFIISVVVFSNTASAIATNSAYISLYAQTTKIEIQDTTPVTTTEYEIIFKFNDEKAIALHHSYSVNYSYFDKLEKIEVFTKNPQPNGKIKTIEIKDFKANHANSSMVFFDDQQEINIDFLGLVVGSEAHVKYTLSTREAHFTDPMTFRYYLPIEKQVYELHVPNNMKISLIEKNMQAGLVNYKKEEKRNEVIHTWTALNTDEEKEYESTPARLYYTPHILYKIDEFTTKGKTRTVTKTPRDLFDWYVSKINQVNSKPSERITYLADSITKGVTSDKEKIKRVYQWVQQNIRYVAFEAGMEGLIPREGDQVCAKRYGDCKDMSSIQFALLKSLKIPCYLTWIGTRRIPYTYTEVPLKNSDNHMIAAVKLDGQWVFLDATDPNGIFGLPTDHIQGKQAMIYISDTTYELVMVPVIPAETNYAREVSTFTLKENDVEIKAKSNYGGLIAGNLANEFHYLTEKEKEDFAKNVIKGVRNNAILQHFDMPKPSSDDHLELNYDYSMKDFVKDAGDEKYINIFLNKVMINSMVKESNRQIPYAFKYNINNEQRYIVQIPENFEVTYIPENVKFKEKDFGFTLTFQQEKNKLICDHIIYTNFPDLIMKVDQFEQWNLFIKQLNKAYKESVILKKIK